MKMKAGQALIKVLEAWDIKHMYGLPGGSINEVVDGLHQEREKFQYIQVRHEEVGAMAASADAKFTGKIGVAFGSAGPGATHLLNGLYDAKMDHVPVLALVGQVGHTVINTNYFQEMDEIPIFSDVAVYNRTAMNSQQIPKMVDEAIRAAYEQKGVAVVVLPNDFAGETIEYEDFKTASHFQALPNGAISDQDIKATVELLKKAKYPVLYVGLGLRGAQDEVAQLSEKLNIPIVSTVPATGYAVESNHPNFMGSFGRLGTKPGFETMNKADLVLFLGTNFPFARYWPKGKVIIQVNNKLSDIGKQLPADLAMVGDAKTFIQQLLKSDYGRDDQDFLVACQKNKQNWDTWLHQLAADDSAGLAPEAVIEAIAAHSADEALYGLDVGNIDEFAVRQLPLDKKHAFAISAWFATMGYGLPAGMAAKLSYPEKQVWTISGDGGFSMVMQDIITEVKYQIPVINVIFSNQALGFIVHEQITEGQPLYGVDLQDADWAAAGEAMGAIGFTVRDLASLNAAFAEIDQLQKNGNKRPIVVNAVIKDIDPIDTSNVILDPEVYSPEEIAAYQKQYNVFGQPALSELLETEA